MRSVRRAVIDVGSNSLLVVVAERGRDGWTPVLETSEVTALGEQVKSTGSLGGDGMRRTLKALASAFEAARAAGAEPHAFGTMALRTADNAPEFRALAEAQGTPVGVISGDEEAELGLRAAVEDPLFRNSVLISIVDVGGHSTEVATSAHQLAPSTRLTPSTRGVLRELKLVFRRSSSVGTLSLREGELSKESPGPAELFRASALIDDRFSFAYLPDKAGVTVALGATATNLVTIRDAITEWDPKRVHGATLTFEEISGSVRRLSAMTDAERAAVPGLERGRERTIHIGALILERALYALRVEECRVSVKGWRHAMLDRVAR